MGDLKRSETPDPGNIPSKEKHESLAYCLDCDDTRIVTNKGVCISCGGQQIHRNGVAKLLKQARDKYQEEKQHILEEAVMINRVYSKEFKRDE